MKGGRRSSLRRATESLKCCSSQWAPPGSTTLVGFSTSRRSLELADSGVLALTKPKLKPFELNPNSKWAKARRTQMFSHGYCYPGILGKAGYKPEGTVKTE